jgi:hypothetical protein
VTLESVAGPTKVSFELEIASETNSSYWKDYLLQVSRRLDWRFLLPNPDFGSVAYLGPEKDSLVEALQLFSPTLTQVNSLLVPGMPHNGFDLVVIKNPLKPSFDLGPKLVKPGGYLYVEACGWSRLLKPRQLIKYGNDILRQGADTAQFWSPERVKAGLRGLGFDRVNTFWHWPNFEACTRIIGLDDTDARTIAFSFQDDGIQAILKQALTHHLLPLAWVQFCVPYFSIIAGKDSKCT